MSDQKLIQMHVDMARSAWHMALALNPASHLASQMRAQRQQSMRAARRLKADACR